MVNTDMLLYKQFKSFSVAYADAWRRKLSQSKRDEDLRLY